MDLKPHFPMPIIEGKAGKRFDQFLVETFPDVSRSRWSALIDSGLFKINEKVIKASHKIKAGEVVHLDHSKIADFVPLSERPTKDFEGTIPEIVFEDESLVVVNKPVGLAVHPGSGVELEKTLAGWLLSTKRIKSGLVEFDDDVIEDQRPGIVHRLDKGTSGLIVLAKDPNIHSHLAGQFQARSAGRVYWAVVTGHPKQLTEKRPQRVNSLIEKAPSPVALRFREDGLMSFGAFLERDPRDRVKFRVSPTGQGKKSLTHFQGVSETSEHTALALKLSTGRTHQIRVHMSFLGFPIVGDTLYGGREWPRMMLHAHQIRFEHPLQKKILEFRSVWDEKDQSYVDQWNLNFKKELLPWHE